MLISWTVIGVPGGAKNQCMSDFLIFVKHAANRNGWTGRGNSEKIARVQETGLATHKRMIRARGVQISENGAPLKARRPNFFGAPLHRSRGVSQMHLLCSRVWLSVRFWIHTKWSFCMSLRTSASLEYGLRWDFIPHHATANVGEKRCKKRPKQVKPGRQRPPGY